jgi:hypothetical protein
MLMKDEEVRTILQDMPVTVKGFCYHDDDGTPVVVLNARLSVERRQKAYDHEMEHIKNGDMYNENYNEYGGTS